MTKAKLTAKQVKDAVIKHYGQSAVIISEVGNTVGGNCKRHMDLLALGCWPSRGLFVHAVEVKISVSDLRRELEDVEKADSVARYCDHFFLATPKGLAEKVLLPPAWGLLEVTDRGVVHATVRAQKLEAAPLDRGFVMAIVRRVVQEQSDQAKFDAAVDAEVAKRNTKLYEQYREREKGTRELLRKTQNEVVDLRRQVGHGDAEQLSRLRGALGHLTGRYTTLELALKNTKSVLHALEEVADIVREAAGDLD